MRLNVRRLSVLSATKIGFLIGLLLAVLGIGVTMVVYGILVSTGALAQLDTALGGVLGTTSGASITSAVSPGFVFAIAVAIAALTVISNTVVAALIALIYNGATRLTDGLLVGFSES